VPHEKETAPVAPSNKLSLSSPDVPPTGSSLGHSWIAWQSTPAGPVFPDYVTICPASYAITVVAPETSQPADKPLHITKSGLDSILQQNYGAA